VRKGDLLCVLDTPEQVLTVVGRFLQYYRENAKYMERTYGFVPRLGIDGIRAVVVEDSEGDAARLDAALEAAIEAYQDPWREAEEPVHPAQFAAVLNGEEAAS
jgi:nitrite reductase (NADH) large subunit